MRRPSELVEDIDATWDALILKAIENNPPARFTDGGEMLIEIKDSIKAETNQNNIQHH